MKQLLLIICAVLCLTDVYAQRERTDNLDSVVVAANKTRAVKRTQISAVSLPASVMFKMPATMGEPDVLKSLQMIPGVIGAGDGNVALHIRGGSSSQNLFIVDGAVLYNPEHFKGYVSAINPVAVNDVLLFKGGFPAQYGNRLSGIVDTELKRGDFNKYHGTANVGLFAASAMVGGPIIKDKLSFMVAGRRSFYKEVTSNIVDLLYSRKDKDGIQYSREALQVPFDNVSFYDFNAKLSYKATKRSIIDLGFYNGRDVNDMRLDATKSIRVIRSSKDSTKRTVSETVNSVMSKERWGNTLASLNWNYIGDIITIKAAASYSRYRYSETYFTCNEYNTLKQEYGKDGESNQLKIYMNQLIHWAYNETTSQYRSDVDRFQISNINSIKDGVLKGLEIGLDASYVMYDPYSSYSYIKQEGVMDEVTHKVKDKIVVEDSTSVTGKGAKNLITGGLFANYNFKIGESVEVDASLRGAFHITEGKTYIYPEPRINAVFNVTPKLAFKASYSFMTQSEHKISTADLLQDSDIWMPSGQGIKPSTSHQVVAGVFYDFKSDKGYALSLEGYYKTMNDILEYKEKAVTAGYTNEWVNSVAVGRGWAYGIEVLAQKTKGKTKGWLSYTWSKSIEKFNREGMELNHGNKFFAPHDCRNAVSLNATHDMGKGFELSATFSYHTGRYRTIRNLEYTLYSVIDYPITYLKNIQLNVAQERNNVKINDYHKLDIAVNYHINHLFGKSTISFGITNVYNNYNISNIMEKSKTLKAICYFPIMPSLYYSYSF